jgi:hypothetical protein
LASPISLSYTGHAKRVPCVHFIEAVRSGDTTSFKCWPVTKEYSGAGKAAEATFTDAWPPQFEGSFEYYTNYDPTVRTSENGYITITDCPTGASFTFFVSQVIKGEKQKLVNTNYNTPSQLLIGAADNTYYGPTNVYRQSDTGLFLLPYNATGFNAVMGYNTLKQDELLRFVGGLVDGGITTTPNNRDAPYYDSDDQTLKLTAWKNVFGTTTSTTSTTTTTTS